MKTIKIAIAVCIAVMICGCFADDVMKNAEQKKAKDNATTVYNGGFGTIRKIYIPNENLTCYVRSDVYQGGLSCFGGLK
jgi:outer membrane lipoprotein SlyB